MKPSKLWLAASLISVAVLTVMAPALSVTAQDVATATPEVVVATETPAAVEATAAGGVEPTLAPREWRALNVARAALAKKINKPLSYLKYVKNWTWELMLFKDSALGCPNAGQTPQKGDTAGYRITITTLGNQTYEIHVTYDLETAYICGSVASGAATGGSALPAPVAGKAVGGGFEAGGQIQDFNGGVVDRMNAAGLKWIKRQLPVGDGNGPAIIAAAKAQGFKTLLSVLGDKSQVLNPGYFDQYASFVGGLAASGADAIEIWNEMNIDREWPNGQINPATYVQMLAKAYNAIKSANGNTIVISGALAPTGYAGVAGKSAAVWNDDVYYQELAAAGGAQYLDCVGVHYNEGIVSPTQSSGDPRDNYPTRYFAPMLNRAVGPFSGKPACFTELGYLTPEGYGPLPGNFAWAQNTTVAQQAQWLADAAVLAAQSGKVRLMIIFNIDFTTWTATDPQAGYAMIRPGGSCPACEKLGAVLK